MHMIVKGAHERGDGRQPDVPGTLVRHSPHGIHYKPMLGWSLAGKGSPLSREWRQRDVALHNSARYLPAEALRRTQ